MVVSVMLSHTQGFHTINSSIVPEKTSQTVDSSLFREGDLVTHGPQPRLSVSHQEQLEWHQLTLELDLAHGPEGRLCMFGCLELITLFL